ncbi:MAG: response regulator [Cyanobacteriota bacterium]|nr:response regulator [Cyanobacteriota bacterium]
MKILVVEDDEFVAQALSAVLTHHNYAVEVASDGEQGWELVQAFDYDLIILDITLPKLDGISLCRKIRSGGWLIPIMLVTGCDSSHEKATGLDAGADDYVVKPFEEEELVARVRALLRRGKVNFQPVLEWGNLRLDPTSCEVDYNSKNLSLTPKEYSLLELFLRNSRRVFSCGMILEHLWSYEDIPSEEAVRTHIKGLRMKLKAVGAPNNLIETVYGIGYRLKPQQKQGGDKVSHSCTKVPSVIATDATRRKKRGQRDEEEASSSPHVSQAQTLLAIAGVWEKYKGRVSEQVNVLLKAALAFLNGESLTDELYSQATAEAHTLAGSLGTFGFANGSKLARQIEHLLKANKVLDETQIRQFNDWVNALVAEIDAPSQNKAISSNDKYELDNRPLLLVVDKHQEIPEDLVNKTAEWKLQITIANSISIARQKLYQEHPNVAVVDGNVLDSDEGLSLLAEFKNRKPSIPVVILAEKVNNNKQAINDSENIILQKPASSEQILETATQLIKKSEDAQATVLAVDDDPKVLEVMQNLLQHWGITVRTLAEPQKFWETLETINPDLLILDVEMPGVSGIELCDEVRNHSRWSELPILFLTVHNEAEIVNQVFSVGADDFVSKPIIGPELVTRIVNRLERIKLIRRTTREREANSKTESVQRWQKIFHTSPECIKLVAADGTLLEMNPAGLEMIEADETAIGKNIYSVIAPEYRQAFENFNKSVCEGNKGSLEFEIIGCKGSRRIVETHAVPLIDPENGKLVQLAITRDITARKQAEAEREKINLLIKAKVQQQASVAQLGQSALLNKDISTLMDETVALVAQSLDVEFCHILEILPSGNVMRLGAGVGWDKGLVKLALLSFNDSPTDMLLTKEPVIIEDLRQETRFNSPTLLEEHGIISGVSVPIFGVHETYGILGVYTSQKRAFNQDDIYFLQAVANVLFGAIEKQHIETTLRKAKQELENKVAERTAELVRMNECLQLELGERQRAQAQFSGILEIASEAIICIDSNQCITLFNQGASEIFGYSVSEVLGKPLDLLLPERSVEAHRHHVEDFGKSQSSSRKMGERREIYGRRKNGSEFPAEASISKLDLGNKTVYTVYLQDVSHRKQVEQMKDEFVSIVSHELRTPLTSIHGSLGMLATDLIPLGSEESKRLVQIATDSTERLVRLINDILDIERIESGKIKMSKQIYEVNDLIRQSIDVVRPLAEKAKVELSTENVSLKIRVDADRIIQILTNLLSNAIRFSSPGDTVAITAVEQGSEILFTVKDNGRGIPEDKLEIIFERFQQVDSSDSRNHEGTGLGLAICLSIIEMHGGKIWAESIMGAGSTFYFTLPLSSEELTVLSNI